MITETSFPRGGVIPKKEPEEKIVSCTKHSFYNFLTFYIKLIFETKSFKQHFGAVTLPKKRQHKPNRKEREAARLERQKENEGTEPTKIEAISAELLTFQSIKEGMTILGCVKQINPTTIKVALPGRMDGIVDVSSISETYLNLAQRYVEQEADEENEYQPLNSLFEVGQLVCVKVMKLDTSKANHIQITLSMQPKEVHADFQHDAIKKGMVMSVAIAERQEHGFVIETGVKNLRGFLNNSQLHGKPANKMIIGGVYTCRVTSANSSKTASTATFELTTKTAGRIVEFEELDVNHILPGILTKFHVTKKLKNGIQGTVFDGSLVAYINEHQLGFNDKKVGCIQKPSDFKFNSDIFARVLYVMPLTKIVYLSLNLDEKFSVLPEKKENYQILPIGTIIDKAIVSHIGTGGIVLKLPKAKGIVSLRSIHTKITANFDKDEILSKYQKDSVHKVRVIHYDPIDLLHVCSVDKEVVAEKHFSVDDVSAGDSVDAVMRRSLKDGRHEVRVGRIKGFIHPMYLSKATPNKKLEAGKRLRCRVLCRNVDKSEIFLTNLPEFMADNAPILTAKGQINVGSTVLGVIKKCTKDGWIVGFFDYLHGMIYRNQLTASEQSVAERFFEGQVMKVTIKHVRNESANKKHITLGLADFSVDIGGIHSGFVSAVQPTGLDVAFPDANLNGFVPVMYLSDFPGLVHGLYRAYKTNDPIETIGVAQNCYSVRDVRNLNNKKISVKKFASLRIDDIIPAFIKNVSDETIEVQCLLKDFKALVKIHLKMFVENYERAGEVTLVPDQKIFVRITAKNYELKTITCSAHLADVWKGDFRQTAQICRNYFADLERIKKSLKEKNPLQNYEAGQIIIAKHTESDRMETETRKLRTFLTDDNVKVYVTQANEAYKAADEQHKIMIVWIDYLNQVMYGTMKKQYFDRMETQQDESAAAKQLVDHPGLKADVLLILGDLMVLYPRKWTNRFLYLPKQFHYNDLQPVTTKGIKEGNLVNVTAIDVNGDHFLVMLTNLFKLYSKDIDQKLNDFLKPKAEIAEEDVAMEEEKEKPSKKRKLSETKGKKSKKANKNKSLDKTDADDVVEPDEDEEDTEPQAKKVKSPSKKKGKQTQNNQDVAEDETNADDNEEIIQTPAKKAKTPLSSKKNKKNAQNGQSETPTNNDGAGEQNEDDEDAQPPSAKKAKTPLSQKKKKKLAENAEEIQTPSKRQKRFSMLLSQVDGAMDLGDSDSDSDDSKDDKLPGVSNFWSTDLNVLNEAGAGEASSSESSSEDDEVSPVKRKKLSSKERFAAARQEEARVREIEKSYADDTIQPTSIDQFDRLVMAEPNNSRAWINYMVFHVQATEIDRARAIAQKALKTIDMREDQERLNIWVALLNMELRFGSKDAFDDAFKEALRVNEPFKIYSICLKIYADTKRVQELCDMVLTVTKKFKQDPDAWVNAAQAYFEVDLPDKAKPLLNRALISLPERDRE